MIKGFKCRFVGRPSTTNHAVRRSPGLSQAAHRLADIHAVDHLLV